MQSQSLIGCGIVQGAYIDCEILDKEVRELIQQGRSIENKRHSPLETTHRLIVLSQDCDISNPKEKYIELATAKPVSSSKSSEKVQKTRSLKNLQLIVNDSLWNVEAELITIIPKAILSGIEGLQPAGNLENTASEILIKWRVNRYARRPFPDNFNKALIANYLFCEGNGFRDFLTNNASRIFDVFAFVRPENEDHANNYDVSLTIILDSDCTEDDVFSMTAKFKEHINAINRADNCLTMIQADGEKGFHPEVTNVAIVCLPADFSFEDAIIMRRLTLDFLCWED